MVSIQFRLGLLHSSINIFVEILNDIRRDGRQHVLLAGLRESCLQPLMRVPEFRKIVLPNKDGAGTNSDPSATCAAAAPLIDAQANSISALFSNVHEAVLSITKSK